MGGTEKRCAKTRRKLSIETKKEIIAKREGGRKISDLASEYRVNKSTIATIIANREKVAGVHAGKGVVQICSEKQRSPRLDEVENLLLLWITERQMRGDVLSRDMICEKARLIFEGLTVSSMSGDADAERRFQSEPRLVRRFRKMGVHHVKCHGEAASADSAGAAAFAKDFQALIAEEGYLPEQVFKCDETGLFWKKMPNSTFTTGEQTTVPGRKMMKERLTLLLGASASGDLKLEPLLVYHSENPRAFKKHRIQKSNLPVFWKSNRKAWVTQTIFKEWVLKVFAPSVKKFLRQSCLPMKALLVLDNAPGHSKDLDEELRSEYEFIKVCYLPPNTTSELQPMDQNVIATFKKLYTRSLMRRYFEACEENPLMDLKSFLA
ncbi:tigger transposable element-derived protein 1-like [Galendromus occidentalis]|uniref:Tigger transposable element-derived protein 1-like n=1 Tax=Galendromus occidentalis TaxID=34638 RepID=A0AAJ6QQE1_9ACAR|nr:tigger transposable element-derived protein 1-like [Galendromus occidentalis]